MQGERRWADLPSVRDENTRPDEHVPVSVGEFACLLTCICVAVYARCVLLQ